MSVDDLLLPALESDLPFMLPTGSMLRQHAGPMLPVRIDLSAPGSLHRARQSVDPPNSRHSALALQQQTWIGVSTEDPELEDTSAAGSRQAPISEVEAQEICIRPFWERGASAHRAGSDVAACDRAVPWPVDRSVSPISDRRPGNTRDATDLGDVQSQQ
jgi:hypothetical protein